MTDYRTAPARPVDTRKQPQPRTPAAEPAAERPIPIRVHFQKALVIKLGNFSFAGAQGLANWTTDTSKILEKDAAGLLLDIDGRCAFVPWSNVAWIEQLPADSAAS